MLNVPSWRDAGFDEMCQRNGIEIKAHMSLVDTPGHGNVHCLVR